LILCGVPAYGGDEIPRISLRCIRATILADEVNEKHISIIITKHGKPVAKLTPIEAIPVDFFGCLKNIITIQKDIISPIE
jgi:hypothetical protein